jgi:hypothetical protein
MSLDVQVTYNRIWDMQFSAVQLYNI